MAQRQLELIKRWIDAEGLFVDPGNMWIFIDWPSKLSMGAAMMTVAGRTAYWDAASGRVLSGTARQVSWAGASWMMLGGLLPPREGRNALRAALADPAAIRPSTPYLYRYVVEALIACGDKTHALALLESYWGAMIDAGADTFREVFDPANPLSSPYGDIHINSYCHAWSCTPSYFLRNGII
ncbi:hypothetical protein [Sphingobium yanoikuyae]|uniref:hypothetical protein n=1 Tax=Sphingobium yanoikuyae TaxID=13690 RepID=UPI0035AFC0B8